MWAWVFCLLVSLLEESVDKCYRSKQVRAGSCSKGCGRMKAQMTKGRESQEGKARAQEQGRQTSKTKKI